MKNAGYVWMVVIPDEASVWSPSTFGEIDTKLYYDKTQGDFMTFLTPPTDVDTSAIRCISGIWARKFEALTPVIIEFYNNPTNVIQENVLQVRVGLYFETTWRLWIRLDRALFGDISVGGYFGNHSFVAEGHYTSTEDNCFFLASSVFTLDDENGSASCREKV